MATDTFLDICKEVHSKLGFQGGPDALISAQNATGYQREMVDLVSTAWRDIQQMREDYFFLRTFVDHPVTAGIQRYYMDTAIGATGVLNGYISILAEGGDAGNISITLVAGGAGISRDANNNIIYGITDGVTTPAQVAALLQLEADISSASVLIGAPAAITLGVGTDTVTLSGGSSAILASAAVYNRFGHWRTDRFLYTTSNNRRVPLKYIGYDEWQEMDTTKTYSTPTAFSIDPADDSVLLQNLTANANIRLSYWKSAQILSLDADVPEVPRRNRDVIMWAGVLAGAEFFGNEDAKAKAEKWYERTLGVFFRQQVPQQTVTTQSIA